MSNQLLNLAWRVNLPTGRKMVLVALADKADKNGVCWPSLDMLAEMATMSTSTVSEHLSALVRDGYVTRQRRRQKAAICTVVRAKLEGRDFPNQEVSQDFPNQEISPSPAALDFPDQEVSNQDFPNQEIGTSQIRKSLKRTPNEPPIRRRSADDEHPEARKLCEQLAERMVDNGCKQPTITKAWLNDARLLLDKDGRTFTEASAVLDWCQADQFWRKNIQSMPKFREKYDRLRMATQDAGMLSPKAKAPTDPDGITEWVREQWRLAAVSAIEQATGLRYEPPDLPLDITTKADAEAFQRQHRQQWIAEHHDEITHRLTKGTAA